MAASKAVQTATEKQLTTVMQSVVDTDHFSSSFYCWHLPYLAVTTQKGNEKNL